MICGSIAAVRVIMRIRHVCGMICSSIAAVRVIMRIRHVCRA